MSSTFVSPPNSTFIKAIGRGYAKNLPRLTSRIITTNPPNSKATAKGHLDLNHKNQRSSKRLSQLVASEAQPLAPTVPQQSLLELDDFETMLASEGISNDLFV
jgi:hypothetical protein